MEEEQKQVDRIVQESRERAGRILKRMLEPIQTMLDGSADLRSLKEQLDKEEETKKPDVRTDRKADVKPEPALV